MVRKIIKKIPYAKKTYHLLRRIKSEIKASPLIIRKKIGLSWNEQLEYQLFFRRYNFIGSKGDFICHGFGYKWHTPWIPMTKVQIRETFRDKNYDFNCKKKKTDNY